MVVDVLDQLKALRENIAESLKKDPRYLTLGALDRSIAEISSVLSASGLVASDAAAPPPPLSFGTATASSPVAPAYPQSQAAPAVVAPAVAPSVAPVALQPAMAAVVPVAPASTAPAAPIETPAPARTSVTPGQVTVPAAASEPALRAAQAAAPVKKKSSILKPLAATAASLAVGGLAAGLLMGSSNPSAKASSSRDPNAGHESDADDDADEDRSKPQRAAATRSGMTPHVEDEERAEETRVSAHPSDEFDGDLSESSVIPVGKSSGYKAMAARAGASQYQPSMAVKMGPLPQCVDLRPAMTLVENQGNTNSCVANAVAGAYEYWIKKATSRDVNISRLFVYYNARWRDGSQDKDEGSVIQLAMESLAKFGACHEEVWPFDDRLIFKKPNSEAYKLAYENRVHDMAQVPLELNAWKQALAEGKPIVFGVALFESFDQASERGGVVPMPSPDDLGRESHGGHAMCAVGYSDSERVFIVRNSWGDDWGDKGYCYIPYSYLINPTFNFGDSWVFVPRFPAPPPRDLWSNVATTVTNGGRGVDFLIETFTVADYSRVAVNLWSALVLPFNTTVLPDYMESVTFAGANLWSRFESFDVSTYLSSTSLTESVESYEESEETEETEETVESDDSEALEETEETEVSEVSEETDEADDTEESDEPEETGGSEDSDESEETEDSEDSDEPEETEESDDSDEPEETEESDDSDEPEETEESEESDEPEETEESEESDEPEETDDSGDSEAAGDEGEAGDGGGGEEEES